MGLETNSNPIFTWFDETLCLSGIEDHSELAKKSELNRFLYQSIKVTMIPNTNHGKLVVTRREFVMLTVIPCLYVRRNKRSDYTINLYNKGGLKLTVRIVFQNRHHKSHVYGLSFRKSNKILLSTKFNLRGKLRKKIILHENSSYYIMSVDLLIVS